MVSLARSTQASSPTRGWTSDGWPVLQTVGGAWGSSYPFPDLPDPPREVEPLTGVDTFDGATLGPQWEWNHHPDDGRWSVNDGLRLQNATVTGDLHQARNTLTHRVQGPTSTATIELDYSAMRDGDRAGALLRDQSAWIGVKRDMGASRVVMTNGLTMDSNWNTTGTGRQARFFYSTDGGHLHPARPRLHHDHTWQLFMGYRYAIFNYATQALGGAVTVERFELATP